MSALPTDSVLFRVFVGESDAYHGRPVYELVVLKARELGLAGATVLRGVMGYGGSSRIHAAKLLRLSEGLPMVVEVVDTEERIQPLPAYLDQVVTEVLVTMERAPVITYRHRAAP